jgi:hypothetical protein
MTPGAHAGALAQSLVVPELLPVPLEELLDSPPEEPPEEVEEEPPEEVEEEPPELLVSVPEELVELPVAPLLVDPDPAPLPPLEPLLLEDGSL